ncbi:MAG: tetratricopeptide repeat protein [Saprospiraceae bacterium]|nr:tetratricopeptide repeat protein [Saprospiraceae bacterium]MCF8249239.1 tetratricopeptide repeat protein [Saprospiraceae bacterium]MCF8280154.1 tetratricopeptide repeat protein [Bacteroidales bacterium]MCF8311368.1 tetratricopeptide repeat protein [Saprospiraceae bacterium]MCF8442989.1 tetratricopeptide repeat protein [Saprospiraceae bacterium]
MRRSFLLIALYIFLPICWCYGQSSPADSLRQAYLSEKDFLKKADFYYEWAYLILLEKPETGHATADTLEQLAEKTNSEKNLSRAEYLRGYAFSLEGKFPEALPHHRRELQFAMQTNDLELHGKALNSLGNVFHSMGRNDSAIVYLLQSVKAKEQVGNQKDIASAYANIGNVFSDEKASGKAIEYLEKALKIRLGLPDGERSAIFTYNNLSVAYGGKGDTDKAIEYAQKGLELAESSGNKFLAAVLAGNISELLLKKGEVDKAISLAQSSVKTLAELNRKANIVYPYTVLSMAWLKKGDPARALAANQQGYAIMEELKLGEPLAVYYENFANAYEALGDHKQAFFWLKKFMVLDDSLFNKEKISAIAEIETKFETEKKEAQLVKQQLELERQSGQKRTILISAIAAMLALGGGFQYFRNKQRIKQKETELAAQLEHAEADKLREMNDVKSTFFANISHEFRTPLTLIVSPLEQMMNGSFQGDFQKYYRIMHRNGKRLLDLVNQLLDLSRLESGKLKLQVSEGDLGKFVSAIAFSFESLADRQHVDLQVVVPKSPLVGYFDSDKLEKILSNLISNAFKFTSEGGKVEIRLSADSSSIVNRQSSIVIHDTGIGIAADQLPHIFERFSKTTTSEVQPGSGIGLALTKELVELHGGKIEVESTEGTGSTFTVTLPIDKAFFKPDEIVAAPEQTSAAMPTTQAPPSKTDTPTRPSAIMEALSATDKPVLLIAEDNADVRSYIVDQFKGQYQILEAENGRLGLKKALENTPDLIISDIMMPEMDGTEFCKLLKINEKTSHIPVVMLTALAEQGDKLKGLETGADDYLVKPFDARELQVRVANLIAGRQKLQEHYRKKLNAFAPKEVKSESLDAVFLNKVREAVEANLDDENFSVVELGAQVGMSRSQLHRKLSALTGFSPNEVIRNMRLERAKQLLEQKAGNASEVAYMTGFNSPAYFAKCFKDYFGVTPSEV